MLRRKKRHGCWDQDGYPPRAINLFVHVETVKEVDNSRAVLLKGEVKPGSGFLSAGAVYFPALGFGGADNDISGIPVISFRTRGDDKTYTVTLFDNDGNVTTKYLIARKEWSEVTFPFTGFGSDGKHEAKLIACSNCPRNCGR